MLESESQVECQELQVDVEYQKWIVGFPYIFEDKHGYCVTKESNKEKVKEKNDIIF